MLARLLHYLATVIHNNIIIFAGQCQAALPCPCVYVKIFKKTIDKQKNMCYTSLVS